LALFSVEFGVGFFDLVLTSYLVSLGCSPELASCFYTICNVFYTLFSYISSHFPPSTDMSLVIFAALAASVIAFVLCAPLPPLSHNIWVIALGVALEGAGLSTIIGTHYSVAFYSHVLVHSTTAMGILPDDQLSDKISSNLYPGYGAATTALGLGTGPIFGGLMVELVGMEQSFSLVAGIFVVVAVLYTSMTGLWRKLLCMKEEGINIELQVQLL
jgi:MFS family permease